MVKQVLALSGGVGGAKLALGLSRILGGDELSIVANTGDDFRHYGLAISPDLDTLMYTLSGLSNQELGWGLENESWDFLDALERLGGESWFKLGDRDLATHVMRTAMLDAGQSLSSITAALCQRLGIEHAVFPMSDELVSTEVLTGDGWLSFQDYFVRQQCQPAISDIRFAGIAKASASAGLLASLESESLAAVIICPSNPFVSVEPILSLAGVRDKLKQLSVPVIAVSPIVAGQALKGPAAKMMAELNVRVTAEAVADHYRDILDGFVVDSQDADASAMIEAMEIAPLVVNTVMSGYEEKVALARDCMEFIESLD